MAPDWVHLRIPGPREWSDFPQQPDADRLDLEFDAQANPGEWTLRLRQQDVKATWQVTLNGKSLGPLGRDENDMVVYFAVPAGAVVSGKNSLRVEQRLGRRPGTDDIRIGQIALLRRPRKKALSEAALRVSVQDSDTGRGIPARITILDADGALHTVSAESGDHLAVRPGTVYTSTGSAAFELPAGEYTLYAGRGFEYSLASAKVSLRPGEEVERTLSIRREVPTEGYVACDTHVHSLTHSGHGDATVEERMITIAAEGIELPVATDHNVQIDHGPWARQMNVTGYFTPAIGNEVTTPVGHFNIFPLAPGAEVPNHRLTDWPAIFEEIRRATGARIVILNHARDLHSDVRPFGPERHIAAVAENRDGWPMGFNGLEVVNSGATQTDWMRPFRDWMALLNRGAQVTPVGSSDSHDVARHFVGQGRTYIRCDDRDPGAVDLAEAAESFLAGRVMVSYGLLAELTVEGRYRSGELATLEGDEVRVRARVLGPHWTRAERIELFANGRKVREAAIGDAARDLPEGVKWQGQWTLKRPAHDLHLVAIAHGPGIEGLYWRTAKPYQPTSPDPTTRVVGCSGAVWLDADSDGKPTPGREYARRLCARHRDDPAALLASLAEYDSAVAAHAAHLYDAGDGSPGELDLKDAAPPVREGWRAYLESR